MEMRIASDVRPADLIPAAIEEVLVETELVYVCDSDAGIVRKGRGRGFSYIGADGALVRDPGVMDRIRGLVIPPAWTDVWICADPMGHIQATGRDEKGRKQYRYHARWQAARDETKFDRIMDFAERLPVLRARIARDRRRPDSSREKVLATVVHLLETTLIRIGNDAYARQNKSYGLTTLHGEHVEIEGAELRFRFTGKSGKVWQLRISDRRLARVVRGCQELPGQRLFQYVDKGEVRSVTSADVNDYLRDACGAGVSAKDIRTWSGTVLAATELAALPRPTSPTAAKRAIAQAIKKVAIRLGNTPAICRRCYVHPEILTLFESGRLAAALRRRLRDTDGFSRDEAAVLALLRRQRG